MKIGMTAIGIGKAAQPGIIKAVAENADRLGFGTLWAPEHVVLFDEYASKYPYSEDGRFLAGSTIDLLDPFVGLTYAAAYSARIRLATGICLVPEHNPLVLAKVIASLDSLSRGRLAPCSECIGYNVPARLKSVSARIVARQLTAWLSQLQFDIHQHGILRPDFLRRILA